MSKKDENQRLDQDQESRTLKRPSKEYSSNSFSCQEEYVGSSDFLIADNAVREIAYGGLDMLREKSEVAEAKIQQHQQQQQQQQQQQRQDITEIQKEVVPRRTSVLPKFSHPIFDYVERTCELPENETPRTSTSNQSDIHRDDNWKPKPDTMVDPQKGQDTANNHTSDIIGRGLRSNHPPSPRRVTTRRRSQVRPGAVAVRGMAFGANRRQQEVAHNGSSTDLDDVHQITEEFKADVVPDEDLEHQLRERVENEVVDVTHVIPYDSKEFNIQPTFESKHQASNCKGSLRWGFIAGGLVTLALCVGLVLWFQGQRDTVPATTTSISPPSLSDREFLIDLLSIDSIEGNQNQHQFEALEWMLQPAQLEAWNIYDPANKEELMQRYSLAVLYYSTGEPSDWSGGDDFLLPTAVCEWTTNSSLVVIDCDETFQILGLTIEFSNVNGTLPTELSLLTSIQRLQLVGNPNLHGTLPSELDRLSSTLTTLHVSDCHLTGTIPASLNKLSILQDLDLSNNYLTGMIPSGVFLHANLLGFEVINLSYNRLMGTIPPFNSQSDFRVVQLDHNDLTGSIPPTLYANRQLEKIDLSYNQLTGAIGNQIVAATKLTHLALEHNQLKESIPTQMGELFNLRYITLDHNQLSGSIPVALGDLWDCETLNLSENRLSGTIPEELGNMNSLQFLFLHSNLDLLGSIPASLATKKEPLLEFQVYNTTFSDGLENSFCLQPVFPNITADCQGESPQIRCSCCSLCFDAQDHLENSTKL